MMDLLTGDGGLAIFTAAGIVATAFSIVRDARAQKARSSTMTELTEEVAIDLQRAA